MICLILFLFLGVTLRDAKALNSTNAWENCADQSVARPPLAYSSIEYNLTTSQFSMTGISDDFLAKLKKVTIKLIRRDGQDKFKAIARIYDIQSFPVSFEFTPSIPVNFTYDNIVVKLRGQADLSGGKKTHPLLLCVAHTMHGALPPVEPVVPDGAIPALLICDNGDGNRGWLTAKYDPLSGHFFEMASPTQFVSQNLSSCYSLLPSSEAVSSWDGTEAFLGFLTHQYQGDVIVADWDDVSDAIAVAGMEWFFQYVPCDLGGDCYFASLHHNVLNVGNMQPFFVSRFPGRDSINGYNNNAGPITNGNEAVVLGSAWNALRVLAKITHTNMRPL